jgi:hypothetical protein
VKNIKINVTESTIDDVADEIIMMLPERIDGGDHEIYLFKSDDSLKIMVKGCGSTVTTITLN